MQLNRQDIIDIGNVLVSAIHDCQKFLSRPLSARHLHQSCRLRRSRRRPLSLPVPPPPSFSRRRLATLSLVKLERAWRSMAEAHPTARLGVVSSMPRLICEAGRRVRAAVGPALQILASHKPDCLQDALDRALKRWGSTRSLSTPERH